MKLYVFRAEELPETCRVSCQNKLGKLVHLVGFIIKKFVTMHGHVNVKFLSSSIDFSLYVPCYDITFTVCTRVGEYEWS